MKSIEEWAKEYSKGQWDVPTALKAYIAGATEQKVIDDAERTNRVLMEKGSIINYQQGYHDAVEKACKWLEKELQKIATDEIKDDFLENNFTLILKSQVPIWLRNFRKSMKEKAIK